MRYGAAIPETCYSFLLSGRCSWPKENNKEKALYLWAQPTSLRFIQTNWYLSWRAPEADVNWNTPLEHKFPSFSRHVWIGRCISDSLSGAVWPGHPSTQWPYIWLSCCDTKCGPNSTSSSGGRGVMKRSFHKTFLFSKTENWTQGFCTEVYCRIFYIFFFFNSRPVLLSGPNWIQTSDPPASVFQACTIMPG